MRKRSKGERWLVVALLAVQAVCLLVIAWRTGPGWDEWGHLPSGLFTLQYGDHTPYCVNPPLARVLGAIPVWLGGGGIEYEPLPQAAGFRGEGLLGLQYIEQQNANVFKWISVARTATCGIALLGTYLIWSIGQRLFSVRTAWIAAWLWVFSPTVLTFGASITPDVTAAVFGLLAVWRFWLWLRLGTFGCAVWLGISAALAMLSKSTWLVLPPVLIVMTIIYGWSHAKRWRWRGRLGQGVLVAGVCWLTIHAAYEFEGTLVPLRQFEFISRSLSGVQNEVQSKAPKSGNRFRDSWLGHVPAPLPAAYMRGIDIQKHDFETKMQSYFFGEWRDHGWWNYYLVGIWLKEPAALWFMAVGGLCFWGSKRFCLGNRRRAVGRLILFLPGTILFVFVSSQTGFNHHLRYILPFLPSFYLLVATGVSEFKGSRRLIVVGLLVWYAISSLVVLPRSYAYFTEVIGGPSEGWRYLGDSNLDWGQDLVTAKSWIEANPDKRPVYLVYSLPMIDFHKLGIDAEDGNPAVALGGPTRPGWWIVFARPLLDPQNRWFRENHPTQRLSVTTSVFEVSVDDVKHHDRGTTAEAIP